MEKMRSIVGRYSDRGDGGATDVRLAFQSYKKILDDNGRALEIITDMGEKMSGGYLFDIVYIRKAYLDLSASVSESLKDFNQLTGSRYERLANVFTEIDAHIEGLISGRAGTSGRLAVRFDAITPDMAREVGGKNYHLSEVRSQLGLEVPEGIVLTVHAYEQFVKHNRLGEVIAALEDGGDEPGRRRLRERILAGELPAELDEALARGVEDLRSRCGASCRLAVRSSSEEEDDVFSFAGQFETVLGVPAEAGAVRDAYRRVLASLFSDEAVAYQQRLGYTPGSLRMAVGIMVMVDARSSGVTYTADPLGRDRGTMLINAAWGLGRSVVEGRTDTDLFTVDKEPLYSLIDTRLGKKETMTVSCPGGGVEERETPKELRQTAVLTPEAIAKIAGEAQAIENFYHHPQDIEWAVDGDGQVFILQARPLRIRRDEASEGQQVVAAREGGSEELQTDMAVGHPVLLEGKGSVVQAGAVSGRVVLASSTDDLEDFPRDAILVARNDSPLFVRAMTNAAAIITDSGSPASHMASISREFRVPTVVGAGNATSLFKPGAEITLNAGEDGSVTVYEGIARDIIDGHHDSFLKLEELYEFRRRKYIMKFITPLHLVNPFTDEFVPERCRTVHDVLRFIHEKSMQALIESARHADRRTSLKRLDLPFMDDIHIIDIGAGLTAETGSVIKLNEVTSVPLRAVLQGMSYPGAWRKGGVPISLSDFFTASMRTGSLANDVDINLAVISRFYMNLAVRFGYHYSVVDCYCSERAASNHIYFRFMGGAADLSKRLRRIELLEIILKHLGFITKARGDMITATVTNLSQAEAIHVLDQAGRLMAFTRQLDAMLVSDKVVQDYARRFIDGDYDLFKETSQPA